MMKTHLKIFFLLVLQIVILTPVIEVTAEDYTYKLTQSTADYQLWTTLPTERVFKDDPVPAESGSHVKLYAARNEFEPFQVIVNPASSGNVLLSIGDFGSGITTELYQVKFVHISQSTDYLGKTGDNPDPLWPIESGDSIAVTADENTSFWFSVHVPGTVSPGDYSTNVNIGGIDIPVMLHVFNFAIPNELHVKSQMNFSHQAVLTKYSVPGTGTEYWAYVDSMKQFMIDHRLTPKSALWPGGLTGTGGAPYIDYDCNGTLTDNYGIWGFEDPAEMYLDGLALESGVGFPSFMSATFVNNDASADQRPATFCGVTRTSSDWYTGGNPSSPYNQKWFQYIGSLNNYLDALGYLDKAYYYFANEPQDQEDYDAVAWYSQELKRVAPDFKLMVSEEPKPEIYNHPVYAGAKIDIWLAFWGMSFGPEVADDALDRLENHDEETWIYFLHNSYLPRFNPITIDHPGIESMLTGWFLWKYRLRGLAYWTFNNWNVNPWTEPMNYGQNGNLFLIYPPSETNLNIAYGSNHHRFVPSIRLELMRDGLECYEYFYLLNNESPPQPNEVNTADAVVDKIIGGLAVYNRDSKMIYNLRRLVGLKIGGEIASIPDIEPDSIHPRSDQEPGNYYINFQDPEGEPTGTIIYNGHTYMKIGNSLYNPVDGYGWYKAAEVPDSDFYCSWDQWVSQEPKELLGSAVIDTWGRNDVFEFDLPNGRYNVTVCVGYRGGDRYHRIMVEGTIFIDNEMTNNSWIIRTKQVEVKDKRLSLTMGMLDRVSFINYLDIEALGPPGDLDEDGDVDGSDLYVFIDSFGSSLGEPGYLEAADFDLDGVIGPDDLSVFAAEFGEIEK